MFIIWICKYYSFKRGFPEKKKVEEWSLRKKNSAYMNTYFLVRHNDHIATWHQITRETWIWSENSKGCWLVNFLENKKMIRNDSNLLWKRSPYLLSGGAIDILLTKSKDRRLYTTTRSYFRSSRVHNHCSSLFKKISQSLCISKKTFFERSNNIYTILIIVFHEHWVRNHFICVKEAMKNLLNLWTLTIAFDEIESIWDDAEI